MIPEVSFILVYDVDNRGVSVMMIFIYNPNMFIMEVTDVGA